MVLAGFSDEFVCSSMKFHDVLIQKDKKLLKVILLDESVSYSREARESSANLRISRNDLV